MGWLSGFAESSLHLSCWLPIVDASECPLGTYFHIATINIVNIS